MNAPSRHRRAGATLIELMVSLAIFSVIAMAALSFMLTTLRVNQTVEAQADTSSMGQQALDDLRGRLSQSRRILDIDSGFLDIVDLTTSPEREGVLRLPRIDATASLSPRAGAKDGPWVPENVGNAILFVESLPPYRDAKTKRFVDRYQFALYYLARREGKIGSMPYVVDLMRFESVQYADFTQLDAMDEETLREVVAGLAKAGITYAWDAGAPPQAAFSKLAMGRIVEPPEPGHRITPKSVVSAMPGVGTGQRGSGVITYTVAPNAGDLPIRTVVPRFAKPADGFPNGFEVLIAGPGHGRKVLVRLVVVGHAQQRFYSREHQMLAAVWD